MAKINLCDPVSGKKDFFHPINGSNAIRLANMEADEYQVHWSQRLRRTLTCAGPGCPMCGSGDKARSAYLLLVMDRCDGRRKVWETTHSVRKQLVALAKSLPKTSDDWLDPELTDFELTVRHDDAAKPKDVLVLGEKTALETFQSDGKLLAAEPLVLTEHRRKLDLAALRQAAGA